MPELMRSFASAVPPPDPVPSGVPWSALASLHEADCALDEASVAELRRVHATNPVARAIRDGDPDEGTLTRTAAAFRESLALDTVLSEYLLHPVIHQWFVEDASAARLADLDSLCAAIYDEVFLTPRADPWLGLASPDVYLGIDHGALARQAEGL